MFINSLFDTRPLIVHAQGQEGYSPYWPSIQRRFFDSPRRNLGGTTDLTVLTWNNRRNEKGIFERSLDHLGVPYQVLGQGVCDWANSLHKPTLTATAMNMIDSEYVLAVDSWDAICLGDPRYILDVFVESFSCELVFNAGKVNWPNVHRFRKFERSIADATESEFRYLNGGAWIGKTEFCRHFFAVAASTMPLNQEPRSEQGILKQLFPHYYPQIRLDYRCQMFQTLQYVFAPIFCFE